MNILRAVWVSWVFSSALAWAVPPPPPPMAFDHPGSLHYSYSVITHCIHSNGHSAIVVMPKVKIGHERFPVIVFGKGHAVPFVGYQAMFEHLAGKGVVMIFPEYSKSWWDIDFHRMAQDYNAITAMVFQKFVGLLDEKRVTYSGHSYGALVALLASGVVPPGMAVPKNLVLFETSSYEKMADYYSNINPDTKISVISGDQDEPESAELIYKGLPLKFKQLIILRSYLQTNPKIIASHGLVRTFGWLGPVLTPLHYYGVWKFLGGAALSEEYLYGKEASTTGIAGFEHGIWRSW